MPLPSAAKMATMVRTRTGTGTQVITADQECPSLQIVSLAGQSGFSRNANVHGFSSSSTGGYTQARTAARGGQTQIMTATRGGQTQTMPATQTRIRTATGAPGPGDPGGSRTMTAFEDKKRKKKARADEEARKRREMKNEKAKKKEEKLEQNERARLQKRVAKEARAARKAAGKEASKEEGGCLSFKRKEVVDIPTAPAFGDSSGGDGGGSGNRSRSGYEEDPKRGTGLQKRSMIPNQTSAGAPGPEDPGDNGGIGNASINAEKRTPQGREVDEEDGGCFCCMRFFTKRSGRGDEPVR